MKIGLKLTLVNFAVVFVNFIMNSAIWSKNVVHDMTPAIIFMLVLVMCILNLSYYLGLKKGDRNAYFWPIIGSFIPSLVGVVWVGFQNFQSPEEMLQIEFTVLLTNMVLNVYPFYILIQYQKGHVKAN